MFSISNQYIDDYRDDTDIDDGENSNWDNLNWVPLGSLDII